MRQFVKLYGPVTDQVCVMRIENAKTGRPEVRAFCHPPGNILGICSVATEFADHAAGNLAADIMFDAMTEAKAREMLSVIYEFNEAAV